METVILRKFTQSETLRELEQNIRVNQETYDKAYDDELSKHNETLIRQLTPLYGKFLLFKSKYITLFIMPYRYIKENDCLFGLICRPKDLCQGGMTDGSIHLMDILQFEDITITEITEEQFKKESLKSLDNCMQQRLDKIKSKDYILTDKGFVYKNQITYNCHSLYKKNEQP